MPTYKLHRIAEIAQERDISMRKVAKLAGFKNASTLHMMIQRNSANPLNILKVAEALNISMDELVEGLDLSQSNQNQKALEKALDTVQKTVTNIRQSGMALINHEGLLPLISFDLLTGKNLKDVLNDEERLRKYLIPMVADADYLIFMPGTAMVPRVMPGDILICKVLEGSLIEFGQVYVIEHKEGFIIRVIEQSGSWKMKLSSPNTLYGETIVDDNDVISLSLVKGLIRVG